MSRVALRCPDCGYWRVYMGRGRCRCGSYLIHHTGRSVTLDPTVRYWDMRDPDHPRLIAS